MRVMTGRSWLWTSILAILISDLQSVLSTERHVQAAGIEVTVSDTAVHEIDPRLFGQFMERPSWGEIGPEAAVIPGTHQLRPEARQLLRRMRIPIARFPGGTEGWMRCSVFSFRLWRANVVVKGDCGELRVFNPYMPQVPYRFRVRDQRGWHTVKVPKEPTYYYQLLAFAKAVRGEVTLPIDAQDAVANLRAIDAVYEKAGLEKRP